MKKFLIIQTAFIGDVVLATALIEKLHLFFSDGEIHFLLRSGNESLLKNNPFVTKILTWEKRRNKYYNLLNLVKKIRTENYTHVINTHRFFSSGLITVLSKAQQTVGFDKNPLSSLFKVKVKHRFGSGNNFLHEVERILSLIDHFTDRSFVKPKIYPSQKDFDKIKNQESYITISPGSVWSTKQWPSEKWIEFIDKINKKILVYLIGGKNEVALCENIKMRTSHQNIKIVAGNLSFLESAALMKNAKMNFVNDSAPLHLCSAVNAPVTAIYCSTTSDFGFTPLSDRSFVIETSKQLDCRPCGLHGRKACPKGHFNCAEIETQYLLDVLLD